jgi:hypothetical protein
MSVTLEQIHDWFDGFCATVINNKTRLRKHIFSGGHIEMHDRKMVTLILEPGIDGPLHDLEQRTKSFIKNIFDDRQLICEVPVERFQKIVTGEDAIKEEDWFWNDEE